MAGAHQALFFTIPYYTIVSGTKAPVFGAGGGTYPPSGWTGLQNASVDDNFLTISSVPFTWTLNSTGYTSFFVGSNTYITFGTGSSEYGQNGALGATRPPFPKIHLGSSDNSYQRVSRFASGTDYQRVRYEGTAGTSGTLGSPNIVYEATFFNPARFGGKNVVEVLVGNHNRTSGAFGIANATTYYASGTIAANQSYVFEGDSTGTSWTINTGFYVGGTDY